MRTVEKQGFDGANFSRPALLGHRGMGSGPGENTLESLAEAVRRGTDGIETDVRRTADGALVLHHDPVIEGLGPVSELTVAQLPAHVPLLEAALDAVPGALVNLEIKNLPFEPGHDPEELTARDIVALLAERGGRDAVIVSAFTAATLEAVVAAGPEVATGFLTTAGYDQSKALTRCVAGGWDALHAHHEAVTEELVDQAHRAGVAVHPWTVNDPERIAWLCRIGVDAVITDDVGAAMVAMGRAAASRPSSSSSSSSSSVPRPPARPSGGRAPGR